MNKIYKLVYDKNKGVWRVVSEKARAVGKSVINSAKIDLAGTNFIHKGLVGGYSIVNVTVRKTTLSFLGLAAIFYSGMTVTWASGTEGTGGGFAQPDGNISVGYLNGTPRTANGFTGLVVNQPSTLTSNVTGGIGATGLDNSNSYGYFRWAGGNGGGGGGTGVLSTADITNQATLIGGSGGYAGYGRGNGGGGGGGAGIKTSASVVNRGTITGGAGSPAQTNLASGGGGAGIFVSGNSTPVTIINYGAVSGGGAASFLGRGSNGPGYGGAGEGGALGATRTTYSDGGAAIAGSNIIIDNYSGLNAGIGGDGNRYYAIDFFGGNNNQLNLYNGSVINGAIYLRSGRAEIIERVGARIFNNNIVFDGAGTFNTNSFDFTSNGVISGAGSVIKTGAGTLILNGRNTYAGGTTVNEGTLQVSSNNNLGASSGALTLDGGILHSTATFSDGRAVRLGSRSGTLTADSGTTLSLTGIISDANTGVAGALTKNGAGSLSLRGNNSYTGETTIKQGTLLLAGDGRISNSSVNIESGTLDISQATSDPSVVSLAGKSAGTLALGGRTLTLSHAAGNFDGEMTGSGGLTVDKGSETLSGTSAAFSGLTTINDGGTLFVNGTLGSTASRLQVNSGGALRGSGTLGGDVTVGDKATLGAGAIADPASGELGTGTLTINGTLSLAQESQLNFQFGSINSPGGQYNDLIEVEGDLVLDGKVNIAVTPGRTFDTGLFRLFNYTGTLTNNILDIANIPATLNSGDFYVQTSIDNVVNLVNSTGVTLRYWDNGTRNNNKIEGQSGTWRDEVNDNWTLNDGEINSAWSDQSFAVFMGTGGEVTIDNQDGKINLSGMQFAVDGYTLKDGTLTFMPKAGIASINVGDGTAKSKDFTATVNSVLAGNSGLDKVGFGTLELTGDNTYSGNTRISNGTLQIAKATALGSSNNSLVLNGGTLNTTASFTQDRSVEVAAGGGEMDTDDTTTLVQSGSIAGSGALIKSGRGTLTLTGANSWSGGTAINDGTLQIGDGGTTGNITGNIINNAALAVNRSDSLTLAGIISGSGGLQQNGTGTTILTADNSYTGATTINSGTLQLGNGSTSGSVSGDITNDGVLAVNRSNDVLLKGVISGSGDFEQNGKGITALSADNTFTGSVTVNDGTLQLGNGGTGGSVTSDITNNATLALNRSDTVTLDNIISGSGVVEHNGTGTTILTGANSWSGGTELNRGTLRIDENDNLGDSAGQLSFNGGSLATTSSFTLDRTVNIFSANGEINTSSGTVLTQDRGISGSGALIKSGRGTLTLTGANSWSGGTAINEGTLQIGDGGTTGNITGNIINNAALAVNRSDSLTLGGIISGSGELQQNGTGTTILTADNSYTGATTINAGTLQLGNGGTSGSVSGDITNDGVLAVNRSNDVLLGGLISGSGDFEQNGKGITALSADNTFTGSVTVSDGTLQLGTGGTSGSVTSDITNNATLALNRSDTVTLDNVISGSGVVEHNGTGTTVLTGANSWSGGTVLNRGTLQIGENNNLGDSAGQLSFNGGSLATTSSFTLDRTVNIFSANGEINTSSGTVLTQDRGISGSGALIKSGRGTLTLTGANSWSGGTAINEGTLQIGDGGTTGNITGNILNNATLVVERNDELTLDGTLAGSGVLQKNGAGELIVSGNYALSGGTWVNDGTLTFSGNNVVTNIIGQSGAALNLRQNTTLTGWVDPLDMQIDRGALWNMNGAAGQNILDTLTLAGHINSVAPASFGGFAPRNLTVTDLNGQNGTVTLNTRLGDENSATDRIIVDGGSATGTTGLAIRNMGGGGARVNGDGILLVQALNNGTTDPGAFQLSQPVYAGVYQYSLVRGSTESGATDNWYLTSSQVVWPAAEPETGGAETPEPETGGTGARSMPVANYRPGVSTAVAEPLIAAAANMALMSSFYERSGFYGTGTSLASAPCAENLALWCASESRAWGRYINNNIEHKGDGKGIHGDAGPRYNQDIHAIQFGNDFWRAADGSGNLSYAGLYGAIGTSKSDVTHSDGRRAGQNHTDAYSVGAYFTHIRASDAWVDSVLQGSWLKTRSQSDDNTQFNTRGYALATSLEGGYPLLNQGGWKLEPQVRVVWQYQKLGNTDDGLTNIHFEDYQSLQASAGIRLANSGIIGSKKYALWLNPRVGREFMGTSRTDFAAVNGESSTVALTTKNRGETGAMVIGGSIGLNQTLSLYTSANWSQRFDNNERSLDASVGVRGTW
ncbi:autotransporter-associated beta strand repeat-containing protein [Buttiauxella warmboldiae]|nr:autotransporter-associated beta strand repeat-containing protein [Buttiauxella warmboldiae]